MSTLGHSAARETAPDPGCLVPARTPAPPSAFASPAVRPPSPWRLAGALRRVAVRLRRWALGVACARELRRMPDHVLADLGIERGAIDAVAHGLARRRLGEGALRA